MARHDIAFHKTIAAATGNALFSQIVSSFARAIADRDPDAACAAMSAHFDRSIDDLLRG